MKHYIDKDALVAEIDKRIMDAPINHIGHERMWAYKNVKDIINTLELKEVQEEPVSIWHNMDEVPIKGEVIVVQTKDTFYGLSVQKGGTTYKNKNKDKYVKWAYASDLLNLSNVERIGKDRKEEPVSEDLERVSERVAAKAFFVSPQWTAVGKEIFKAGAEWGKNQAKVEIQAQSMALAYECPKEEPVSEELEKAAIEYCGGNKGSDARVRTGFIMGAEWQKRKTLSDVKKAVTGKLFQFSMDNVEACGDDFNGNEKTIKLKGRITFQVSNPESIIDALIAELENDN